MFREKPLVWVILSAALVLLYLTYSTFSGSNNPNLGDNLSSPVEASDAPSFAVPEISFGPIMTVISMFAALMYFMKRRTFLK